MPLSRTVVVGFFSWLAYGVEDIGQGTGFRSENPGDMVGPVQQLIDIAFRIADVAEITYPGGTCLGAGRQFFTSGQTGVKAEVTFVDGSVVFFKVAGAIWTGGHACFTADAALVVHHDDAVGLIFISGGGGADPYTGRAVTVVAENRHENLFFAGGVDGLHLFQDFGSESVVGDIIGFGTGFHAAFAVNATVLHDHHGIMWLVGIFWGVGGIECYSLCVAG